MKKLVFVIFGGTGDLAKRKLAPAFKNLIKSKKISEVKLIGVARGEFTDESYKKLLFGDEFLAGVETCFVRGDIRNQETFEQIKKLIGKENKDRIFYLATGFSEFPKIVEGLSNEKLNLNDGGFCRVMFEKPFGEDFESSKNLTHLIQKYFSEEQIYRVDHYLAKETVRNINVLKFMNPLIYGTFNDKFIESIEFDVLEDLGVSERINYYNKTGAVKDMLQNHLLQVLSLILMEQPSEFNAKEVHSEKKKILEKIEVVDGKSIFGVYEGYFQEIKEKGLKNSETETFIKTELRCNSKKWKNTLIILRTGKKLKEKRTQIRINYRPSINKFGDYFEGAAPNQIIIDVYPKQDVFVFMNSRDKKCEKCIKPVKFEFCYECEFGPNTSDEYASLIEEVINGNNTLFASGEEISESWKIVEKIQRTKRELIVYPNGTEANLISK